MSKNKNIYVEIQADDRASAKLTNVQNKVKSLDRKQATVHVKAEDDTQGVLDSITEKLNSIGNTAGGGFSSILSSLGGIAAVGGAAVVALDGISGAVSGLTSAFITYNASMEDTETAFTSMMGSAESAKSIMVELRTMAAKTPFEFQDLAPAAQQLKAFGFEAQNIIPTLTAVGNASAGLGKGAEGLKEITFVLGQIKATGKLMGQDVMQLSQLGIPVKEILAKNLKLTADQLADIGRQGIDADTAIKALTDGMNERFPDMMDKMSQTFNGMMSSMRDDIGIMLGSMGEGIFNSVEDKLSKIKDLFDQMTDNVTSKGWKDVFDGIIPDNFADAFRHIYDTVEQTFSGMDQIAERVKETFANLFSYLGGASDSDFSPLLNAIDTIISYILNLENIVWSVASDISSIVGGIISWIYKAVSSFEQWIISTFNGFFGAFLKGLASWGNGAVATVHAWLSAAYNAIKDFVNKCLDSLGAVGKGIRAVASAAGKAIDVGLNYIKNSKTAQALANPIKITASSAPTISYKPASLGSNSTYTPSRRTSASPLGGGGGGGGSGKRGSSGRGKSSGGASSAEKAAEEAKRKVDELTKAIANDLSSLSDKIMDETGTTYEKGMSKLASEVNKIKDDITKATSAGIDTTSLKNKLDEYEKLVKAKVTKAWKEANEDLALDTRKTLASVADDAKAEAQVEYEIAVAKINRQKETELKKIAMTSDSAEARVAIEQWASAKIAEAQKTLAQKNRGEAQSWSEAWQNAIESIKAKWGSVAKQMQETADAIIDDMVDGFTNVFTDVLTGDFKNIGDSFKAMLKNMLKEIANFMAKQALTSLFNRGGGDGNGNSAGNVISNIAGALASVIGHRANGGPVRAGHAYIVGENQPELFVPNRSGTILPSINMGGNVAPTVQVVVENNTGNEMKAQQTNEFSNGKWLTRIILSTVTNAVGTNEGGLRDAIASV